jgi:hypothetical protein
MIREPDLAAKLLSSNPYLRDPATRQKSVREAAASSSAVEGIRRPFAPAKAPLKAAARRKTKSS